MDCHISGSSIEIPLPMKVDELRNNIYYLASGYLAKRHTSQVDISVFLLANVAVLTMF
jgi:hypothetical protein